MQDLQRGGPLYQRDYITAEDIFSWYKQLPAFENVVLDQFKDRLKDHRQVAAEDQHRAMQQEQYMEHDQRLYPRQPVNERGEPVFDMHPAKLLLREDIKNKVHLTTYKMPGKLQASRLEYKVFKPKKFMERILQEIRRVKYFHYLELKREAMRK
jgi:hypothetical protein